jgi:hypothetical protein
MGNHFHLAAGQFKPMDREPHIKGSAIARRATAMYRTEFNILPWHLREFF